MSKKPVKFNRIRGVTIKEFGEICERVKPLWQENVKEKKRGFGRPANIRSIEDKILALLM